MSIKFISTSLISEQKIPIKYSLVVILIYSYLKLFVWENITFCLRYKKRIKMMFFSWLKWISLKLCY